MTRRRRFGRGGHGRGPVGRTANDGQLLRGLNVLTISRLRRHLIAMAPVEAGMSGSRFGHLTTHVAIVNCCLIARLASLDLGNGVVVVVVGQIMSVSVGRSRIEGGGNGL